jgi:hypothetical protein
MAEKQKEAGNKNMEEMIEVYQKLGTPGEPHRMLATMAGKWDARVKSWPAPDRPPMESSGVCEQKMVLGGRFLQQDFTGDMMGTTFTGIGFTGYDNHSGKYLSTWMDSMGTGILFFKGTSSADGKTITQENRHNDPVRGPMTWRSVTRIVDNNTWVFEMYSIYEKGAVEKGMEITYTRKQ